MQYVCAIVIEMTQLWGGTTKQMKLTVQYYLPLFLPVATHYS